MSLVGQGLLQLILVLGVTGGVVASRLVRGAVIAVKENDYLQAATVLGSRRRHGRLPPGVPDPPVGSLVALQVPILVGGSVIIENIFNLPRHP